MDMILCGCLGYFIGNINPSYLIAKHRGFDIRKSGSGNAGASNAVLLMGKKVGAFSAIFDIFKAFLAVHLALRLFPFYKIGREVAAIACILGHIFPVFMNFKGGKGLACIGGSVMAYDLKLFCILLLIEIGIALVTYYICIVPITAVILITALYALHCESTLALLLLCITSGVVIFKHSENLRRIRLGTEVKISYLWNPEREEARVRANMDASEE